MENGDCTGQESTEAISLHDFSEKLLEQMVHFHVMKLTGGFFLWVGTSPVLSNLAVSMNSRFDSMPLSTLVLGDSSDTTPTSIAQRLILRSGEYGGQVKLVCGTTPEQCFAVCQGEHYPAKKTKKQVFVSYNLPVTDSNLTILVENRIKKEMELHPDKF